MDRPEQKAVSNLGRLANGTDCVLSWAFGLVLIASGIPHFDNPYLFLGSVYAYDLFDLGLGQVVAMVLPVLEMIVAVCLVARFCFDAAHCLALAMFFAFSLVQTLTYVRGLEIPCGCFGPRHETMIGPYTLATVYALFLLSTVRNGFRLRARLGSELGSELE